MNRMILTVKTSSTTDSTEQREIEVRYQSLENFIRPWMGPCAFVGIYSYFG